jgi:hypothetical protein
VVEVSEASQNRNDLRCAGKLEPLVAARKAKLAVARPPTPEQKIESVRACVRRRLFVSLPGDQRGRQRCCRTAPQHLVSFDT